MATFSFRIDHKSSDTRARTGQITTPHGVIETPAFVPVGTQATVKSLTPELIEATGTQLFFVNTYHMVMRPGLDILQAFGGLHAFMGWDGPLITDSGGFQVFSLGAKYSADDRNESLVKIDDDGVTFASHWDGSRHRFTPESSMEAQHILGSDLMIAFDDCTPYPATRKQAELSLSRTHAWADRSLAYHSEHSDGSQALYGVVQGSIYEDLRVSSARFIGKRDFPGIAIGGVSVGESKEEMASVCDWTIPHLPEEKPRHLLGVGEIDDVFEAIERGVDTFDCVQPTRLARMGHVFARAKGKGQKSKGKSKDFILDITKKKWEKDKGPLDTDCTCYTCTHYSRAYVHHLFRVRELLGYTLTTMHNLHFMHTLVSDIRSSIQSDTFIALKKEWLYNT